MTARRPRPAPAAISAPAATSAPAPSYLRATGDGVALDLLVQPRASRARLGPVHGDLFRDNALFDDGQLSGVIDYYFAGVDALLFDVAVCANDWCLVDHAADRRLEQTRSRAFLDAYAQVRPFTAAEREAWPTLLRAAALRFWLSRLHDFHLPRPGELVHAHDPEHFRDILALRAGMGPDVPWIG